MKRALLTAVLLLAIILPLASCGGGTDGGGVELTVMGKKTDLEKSYMKRIFELYEDKTGNSLKIIEYEDAEFERRAAEDFLRGSAPDILMHFHNADLNRFDIAGNFYFLNDESWVDSLTSGALAYCTDSKGNLLGLPFWESSVSGCYYNKTILDSLGLRPATNQAEFDMLCQALVGTGRTPICWPANGCSWMLQFALDPVFADDPELLEKLNSNELSFADIPAVTDMAEWIANAANSGWFGDNCLNTGWSEIGSELASGDAVMTFIWDTWFYTDFTAGKYGVDDFALMPVFMGTADEGTYEGGNLNMMMVNKNSSNLEAALDFLEFCAAPENCNAAFDGIATVSCFKGQTANIQSQMVTDALSSIEEKQRVSTAASKIIGYSADDMCGAVNRLITGEIDAAGCVKLFDELRLSEIAEQAPEGFQAN